MIGNQKGVGLLIFMMVLVMLILALFEGLNRSLRYANQQVSQEKKVQAGLAALQEFATMAQKANEAYNKSNRPSVTGACPSPSTTTYDSRGFCWPKANSANHADCIRQPLSGKDRWLCLGGTAQPNVIRVSVRDERGWWERRRDQVAQWSGATLGILSRTLLYLDGHAFAQAYKNHLPSLAGAPTTKFTVALPTCTGTPADKTLCKRCNAAGGNSTTDPSLLACGRLEICLRNDTCGANDWVSAVVGVLSR